MNKRDLYSIRHKLKYPKLNLLYLLDRQPLIYYWDYEENWGDSINPFIFESILGKSVASANKIFNFQNREIITGIGSILNSRLKNYSIWGSGFLSEKHSLTHSPNQVFALRGKLSQAKIIELFGIHCDVLGDPGLLFKEFYNPNPVKEYGIGIIPHFKEMNEKIIADIRVKYGTEVNIIDPRLDIFKFADEMKKCENILSSSLHGLVLAESYAIPTARIRLSDKLIGGDFKFRDYYSGVGINYDDLDHILSLECEDVLKNKSYCSLKDLKYSSRELMTSLNANY